MRILSTILFLFCFNAAYSQSYTNWIIGDTSDITTNHQRGWVLAGGGGDNDDAMRWLLQKAVGGDVVVIRSSGADGYNDYFFTDLGVGVNSVESILIPSVAAANDPYVQRRIEEAEVLFIAGGDQYNYYQYWRTSAVGAAVNYLLNTKRVAVGGTSAGMAILGQAYYAPPSAGATSAELLADPYYYTSEGLGYNDFLHTPFLSNTLTDTHFDDRNRAGRLTTFLARLQTDSGLVVRAIACNEYTAAAIDTNGIVRVFGETPQYPEYAYFIQSNCPYPYSLPEQCVSGQPFTWSADSSALRVYKVGGTNAGTNTFDLNDWETGTGGQWQTWWAAEGVLHIDNQYPMACDTATFVQKTPDIGLDIKIYPNPCAEYFYVEMPNKEKATLFVYNSLGQIVHNQIITTEINTIVFANPLPIGTYYIKIQTDKGTSNRQLLIASGIIP